MLPVTHRRVLDLKDAFGEHFHAWSSDNLFNIYITTGWLRHQPAGQYAPLKGASSSSACFTDPAQRRRGICLRLFRKCSLLAFDSSRSFNNSASFIMHCCFSARNYFFVEFISLLSQDYFSDKVLSILFQFVLYLLVSLESL